MCSITLTIEQDPANLGINRSIQKRRSWRSFDRAGVGDEIVVRLSNALLTHPFHRDCWLTDATTRWKVKLGFAFRNVRSDIDGPIKRSLDCIMQGFQKAGIDFDDRAIVDLEVYKATSDRPHLIIMVEVV